MLQQQVPDDFVISTGETHTVKDFLHEVFSHADLEVNKYVAFDVNLLRLHEVPLLLGDSSKAKRILGWDPKVKFKELTRMMYEADLEKFKND